MTWWDFVFFMFVLKIPIVYLYVVIRWAIKAEPEPGEGTAGDTGWSSGPPGWWRRSTVRPAAPARAEALCACHRVRGAEPSRTVRSTDEQRADPAAAAPPTPSPASSPRFSIFFAAIGVFYKPLRLILPAILLALIATGIGGRNARLARVAVFTCVICWVLG